MSVGIGNLYSSEIENGINNNKELNQSNLVYSSSLETDNQKDDISLPNLIKDELLELSFVARELSTKLSPSNDSNNILMKQVSEILDAYFSHLSIIKQQFNYYTNNINSGYINGNNNSNDTNITGFHQPIVTSLMNLKEKIDALLEKLISWNKSYFKFYLNVNKLNKYFERINEEWKNLLLNISVNNITTSFGDTNLKKKENDISMKNKELEENPIEIYITGEKYFYGIGKDKSYTMAFKKYSKAAEYGMPEAMYMVGLMYEKGYGRSIDVFMAINWYNESIKLKYGKAYYSLGNIYENGIGVQKNDKKAYEYYKNGAEIGETSCITSLGRMYENGQYVEENINKAVHWYQMASQKNCPKAQLALGKIYYYGMSPNHISSLSNIDKNNRNYQRVEKNFYEAINLFQKSAEQGETEAQVYLGLCYENGYGVVKDYLMAKMYFEKASKQNDVFGSLYLGKIYMKENNINAALNCFLISLSKGSVDALYYIGKLYDKEEENNNIITSCVDATSDIGLLKSSDKNIAIKYYLQAAEKGHSLAQYRLGNHFCLRKQYIIALYWYLKSSHLSKSQNALGQFYELGFDNEFNKAASTTGLTIDCLLHYTTEQLFSFYNHYCQLAQQNPSPPNQEDSKPPTSNLKEAKKWYYRSIVQGNADAAFNLGQLYETRCFDFASLPKEDDKTTEKEGMTDGNQETSMNGEISQSLPIHKLTAEEIAEVQSRYIQKAILLYEKAKKLGSKEAAERLKQLQSIAYHQF